MLLKAFQYSNWEMDKENLNPINPPLGLIRCFGNSNAYWNCGWGCGRLNVYTQKDNSLILIFFSISLSLHINYVTFIYNILKLSTMEDKPHIYSFHTCMMQAISLLGFYINTFTPFISSHKNKTNCNLFHRKGTVFRGLASLYFFAP